MMEYSSRIQIESQAFKGVAFSILKMSWKRRAELRDRQAAVRERLRAIQEQSAPLSKEYGEAVKAAKAAAQPERDKLIAGGATPEAAAKAVPLGAIGIDAAKLRTLMDLSEQASRIDQEELTPAAVEFALAGIEGLSYTDPDLGPDPVPATLELLVARGPDELYREIAQAVARELGLLPDEASNLELPSTSAAAVDGNATPGSAAVAGTPGMITSAVAPSSTAPESVDARITP
jgi:hypothetical protein